MNIVPVASTEQIREVRRLFEEYAASLSFDLCFQNFQQELDGLPGDYAPPGGGLWLATTDRGEAVGCVAVRRLELLVSPLEAMFFNLTGEAPAREAEPLEAVALTERPA